MAPDESLTTASEPVSRQSSFTCSSAGGGGSAGVVTPSSGGGGGGGRGPAAFSEVVLENEPVLLAEDGMAVNVGDAAPSGGTSTAVAGVGHNSIGKTSLRAAARRRNKGVRSASAGAAPFEASADGAAGWTPIECAASAVEGSRRGSTNTGVCSFLC